MKKTGKRRLETLADELETMRAVSATECAGLMYSPPGDGEERRSYSEIQPVLADIDPEQTDD
ncbi:MAG: hypothetical protein IKG85_11020 [Clostridia bacterium]|nr:hypothetical protein [Clostridia bacterium]